MKLNIAKDVLFRTPLFPVNGRLEDCWEVLKGAIAISSPDFYKEIADTPREQIGSIPQKAQFTIWKYFNRSRYRATPYGRFASFGMAELVPDANPLVIEDRHEEHRFPDWTAKDYLVLQPVTDETVIQTNTTCYEANGGLRYIGATTKGFELMGYENDNQVAFLIELCRNSIKVGAVLCNKQTQQLGITISLIEELISEELLLCDLRPNIIGPDFFTGREVVAQNKQEYLIAERSIIGGGIEGTMFKNLPGLLSLLASLIPIPESSELENFKTSFRRRFEERMIPIMIALDPETGIDYGGLTGAGTDDIAVQFIKQELQAEKGEALKKELRKVLIDNSNKDALDLEQLFSGATMQEPNFPNSMNAIVSIAGDLVCMEQAGGCTATSLLGRFTLASEKAHHFCKELAAVELAANPGVLFFDIGYMAEGYVDNINRRKDIYQYQLSILNYNITAEPLLLRDIYIGIREGQMILWSVKYQKRLVPRLSSAYNFSRSDLPLFRFLCDLQFDGIHPRPFFKVDQIFPYLHTFPRILYRNIVVSKAKWRLNKEEIGIIRKSTCHCRALLQDRNVSDYFSTGTADQKLVFSLSSNEDLGALRQYCALQEELMLEEVIAPVGSYVKDNGGHPYHAEFVLSMVHKNPCYAGFAVPMDHISHTAKNFEPGSVWLYAEIFCHPSRADQILLERLLPLVNEHRHLLEHWFFIRYDEGGHHIRFRIKAKDAENYGKLLNGLKKSLSKELTDGVVADLMLKTYKPEYERYGPELMNHVELHFFKDSEFVLSLLEDHPEPFHLYQLCSGVVYDLIKKGVFNEEQLKEMVAVVSASFSREHSLDTKDYKKLNNLFRDYRQATIVTLTPNQLQLQQWFRQSFVMVLEQAPKERRVKLFCDLMHMHLNRLFTQRQRTHEMIWYYLLEKELRRAHALKKSGTLVC
ncbi:lantibiotic dehydratase [Pedobacter panaciterrae]|uniref:lantibiotic dehydratase n=1 Tax=Pedobacter panaciterrae TaxID=363849 RepID=UPI00259217F0|nr:lantibiotic dehydratase [uncultured Pedobacter sp.]